MNKSIVELYGTFEAWIASHKFSSCAIENEMQNNYDSTDLGPDFEIRVLEKQLENMETLSGEVKSEIKEVKQWLSHFKRRKRNKARKPLNFKPVPDGNDSQN